MKNLLDTGRADDIAEELSAILIDQGGYSAEEAIPGLLETVIRFAEGSGRLRESILDEAVNYLDNGGKHGLEGDDAWDD